LSPHELTGEVEPSPSGFSILRVEQRSVLEEDVRADTAARSQEQIVFDAHNLAEGELPQQIKRGTIRREASAVST